MVYYKADISLFIISFKCDLFLLWYNWKIAHLTSNSKHPLAHSLLVNNDDDFSDFVCSSSWNEVHNF